MRRHPRQRFRRVILVESLESRMLCSVTPSLNWKTVAPMPVPRAEGASFAADGKFYCFGGFDNAQTLTITNEMDAYDPATNTWTRMADCPVKVNDCPVTVDSVTDIAWMGGFFINDGFHASNLVYEYHIQSNIWTEGPLLPMNIGAGQMGVVGRALFYFGGRTAANIGQVTNYRLNLDDPSAGWVVDTPMPYTANHDGAVVLNDKIYAIGGIVNKEETTSNENHVQVFDPGKDQWTLAAPMPIGLGHIASAVTVADGDIIVAGGEVNGNGQVLSNEVLQYDPTTNSWTELTNLPDYRASPFVGFLDGQLIVTGGNMYSQPYIDTATWLAAYSNGNATPPPVTSTTSLEASASTVTIGTAVTFTAIVSDASGTPAGTITFLDNGTPIDTATLNSSAGVSFTATQLPAGSNSIVAQYTGSSTVATSTSSPVSVNVVVSSQTLISTVTILRGVNGTLVAGQSDVLTASVSSTANGPVPIGTITLFDNGNTVGSYPLDANGMATLALAAPGASVANFTARYNGDGTYSASTSNLISQTILPASAISVTFGKVSIPASGIAGQRFIAQIPVVLRNTSATQKGHFTVNVYLDTGGTGLPNHAVLTGTAVRQLELRPARSATILASIRQLPASIAAGAYQVVGVFTDPDGASNIISPAQTVTVTASTVALSATVMQETPATLNPGTTADVIVTITNNGNIRAAGIMNLGIAASDAIGNQLGITLQTQHRSAAIKAAATIRLRLRFKVPPATAPGLMYPLVTISLAGASATATSISPIAVT